MIFKKFDNISPFITLYFKGKYIHPSVFSGILTIISYAIIFSFGVYYAIRFIYKMNPTIYFYNRHVEEAGNFPLNSSSLFHFIRLGNTINNQNEFIDFESVSIFGLEESIDHYISDNNINKYNHWIYGPCNENDAKYVDKLEYVINQNFPDKAACIRQYYDVEKNKYYNINEENFRWPALIHGCTNENAQNYGVIV